MWHGSVEQSRATCVYKHLQQCNGDLRDLDLVSLERFNEESQSEKCCQVPRNYNPALSGDMHV